MMKTSWKRPSGRFSRVRSAREAGMTLANVVRVNIYTTDVDTLIQHFGILTEGFEGDRFATTVVGVARLAAPDILVALEATAMD
jgi:enamine deaminase RidA (YjgF/YER057c/UK114 family)